MRKYSHTALKLFQRCQLKWKYKYIDRLEPDDGPSAAIVKGKKLHDGLEMYHTMDPGFTQWILDADPEDANILVRYSEKWEDEEWEVLHAEEELEFDIGPYTVVYKPDLIIRQNDEVWIVDHKTTANIPDEWDPYNMTDFQHLLYVAAVEETMYPEVAGFIFNYVRTKPPGVPKLVKDGSKIAYLNSLDTTPDILAQYAKRVGMDKDRDVVSRINVLRHAPDKYFQRHYIMAPTEARRAAVRDTHAVLEEMSRKEAGRTATSTYPRHVVAGYGGSTSCARCEYQALCHAELMGMNTDVTLLGYRERETR